MTFIEFAQQWTATIFRIITDLYTEIMSHRFSAFAFWAPIVGLFLVFFVQLVPSVRETVRMVIRARKDYLSSQKRLKYEQRRADAELRRMRLDSECAIRLRKQENRERYAQLLLTQKEYLQSRYVTIEGKRYYRKGLVQRGERMKSSDRDYSYDLEDIDNT